MKKVDLIEVPRGILKVYYNTHLKKLSVVQGNHVIGYAIGIELEEAKFLVREKGRRRTLEEKQKNVHAFVIGKGVALVESPPSVLLRQVSYNPYQFGYFFNVSDLSPVHTAERVWVIGNHCWIA